MGQRKFLIAGVAGIVLAAHPAIAAPPRPAELAARMSEVIRGFYLNWHCDAVGIKTSRELIFLYSQLYPIAMKRVPDRDELVATRKRAQAEAIRKQAAGECQQALPAIAEGLKQARNLVFDGVGKPYVGERSDADFLAYRYVLVFVGLYIDRNCQVQEPAARRLTTERFARIENRMRTEFNAEQMDGIVAVLRRSRAYLDRFGCSPNNRDQIALLPEWLNAMERYIGIKALDDLGPPPPPGNSGITRF